MDDHDSPCLLLRNEARRRYRDDLGAIDFEKKTLFTPRKTRRKSPKPITLPIHPALMDHLLGLSLPEDPAALITPELHRLGTNWTSRIFTAKILPLAGIDPKRTDPGSDNKGRKVSQLSFHSFRTHSQATLPPLECHELRMKITGHSDSKVHGSYTHHNISKLREALENSPSMNANCQNRQNAKSPPSQMKSALENSG